MLANTPEPPYYAVIFTSTLVENTAEYQAVSVELEELAKENSGFLGFEAARNELGIFISYWKDLESIKQWKEVSAHRIAQTRGRAEWYESFKVRIAKVERAYGFER
tara:strand:- start:1111 stop:1428 length:318 start_codon:yes stop_codon:yes gene_type:complete